MQQPRLPPNNAGRPMRQSKCPITCLKWRAGSIPVRFLFSREGGSQPEECTDPDTKISPCDNGMGKHAYQTHRRKNILVTTCMLGVNHQQGT